MALENEQQQLSDAVNELIKLVQGGNADLKKEQTTRQKIIKDLDKGINDAAAGIAKGMGGFGAELLKGDAGLTTMNKVIDTAADAMGAVAKAIPVFGDAVAAGLKAAAEGAKVLIGQLDATAKSFNEISSVGATTARGMSGLRDQQLKSGLSLAQFQKTVLANSETLAKFKGVAGDGAEAFSDIIGRVSGVNEQSDQTLRLLGMNAEQIAQTAGAFLQQQTRLGRSQTMTNDQLAKGTIEYARELDLLSKMTGQSREALQKQQDAALSEARFRAVYQKKMESGNEEQMKSAKEMMTFQSGVSAANKDLGKGIRDLSTGVITSTEAQNLQAATGGKALDIMNRMNAGQLTSAEAHEELNAALKSNKSVLMDQMQYNAEAGTTYGNTVGVLDYLGTTFDQNGAMVKKATATQAAQITETDKLTKDTIAAQLALEGMARELDALAYTLLPDTAKYTRQVTNAMKELVKWVNDEINGKHKEDEGAPGGKAGALAGAASLGVAGAMMGSIIPGIGTAVGGAIGAAVGGVAGGLGLIDFGQTGNKAVAAGGRALGVGGGGGAPGGAPGGGGGGSAPGGGGAQKPMSQEDLKAMGLNIKKGDVQKEGAGLDPRIVEMAKAVQSGIPGFAYFSGFNDNFHQENAGTSQHAKGLAMDFALQKAPNKEEGAKIVDMLRSMGATLAIDEYNNPSAKATAGHIHAQISARDGFNGLLSGPTSGYKPDVTMHGTEALTITPENKMNNNATNAQSDMATSIMSAQLSKLEELVSVMRTQVGTSEKLLRMQS